MLSNRTLKTKPSLILFFCTLSLGACAHKPPKHDEVIKNYLADRTSLKNVYFFMRHGESVPSAEKRVCSSMKEGTDPKNGLTEKGKAEVEKNITAWLKNNESYVRPFAQKGQLFIVTSPFSRTTETAEIISSAIQKAFYLTQAPVPRVEDDLRERFFGKYEGHLKSAEIYKKVWEKDALNANNKDNGVESPNEVQTRVSQLVANLEDYSKSGLYFLVGHGDPLKILQTAFQKDRASVHALPDSVMPIKTAEIRELKLKP